LTTATIAVHYLPAPLPLVRVAGSHGTPLPSNVGDDLWTDYDLIGNHHRDTSPPYRTGSSMTIARVSTSTKGDTMHIAVSGEVDLGNAAALERELRAAIAHQPRAVSVDLTDLTYLDSTGVRILFALASLLRPLRIMMKLIVPLDSPTRRLIELSGLPSLACLHP
jgi:anti-anti-sigma factor